MLDVISVAVTKTSLTPKNDVFNISETKRHRVVVTTKREPELIGCLSFDFDVVFSIV